MGNCSSDHSIQRHILYLNLNLCSYYLNISAKLKDFSLIKTKYTYLTKMHKQIVEGAQSYRYCILENCLNIISKYITNLTLISFTSCNMVTNIFSTITHALTSFTKSRMHTGCCTICSIITNLASHNFS